MLKPVNINKNPRLYYKLDPGEPGMLKSAKASESFRKVTAQERRNIRRMESEARMEGRTVIKSEINYRFSIEGSYPALKAGESVVLSKKTTENEIKPIQINLPEPPDNSNKPEKDNINGLAENPELRELPAADPAASTDSIIKLDESLDRRQDEIPDPSKKSAQNPAENYLSNNPDPGLGNEFDITV